MSPSIENPQLAFEQAKELYAAGRQAEATAAFEAILAALPDLADLHFILGVLCFSERRFEEAVTRFRKTLALETGHAEAHFQLGNAFVAMERYREAEASFAEAIRLRPDHAASQGNLGLALLRQDRPEAARRSLAIALKLSPGFSEAWNNLGNAWRSLGRADEALAAHEEGVRLRPDDPDAHLTLSFDLLLTGQFERGWREYEWRLRVPDAEKRVFSAPRWNGEPLAGKTILLTAEQGYGDNIQFVRYAPIVKALGASVVLEAQRALHQLFGSVPGVDRRIAKGADPGPVDFHIPLPSLPLAFGTALDSIPKNIPYLRPDEKTIARWEERLGAPPGLRVGLNWTGNPKHLLNARRSMPLAAISWWLEIPGTRFFSLQKNASPRERSWIAERGIVDLSEELADFEETAGAMHALDLVISTDTAVAHLAGALGRPIWMPCAYASEWRFLEKRADSPWYPSMRIFRQRRPEEWFGVAGAIASELSALAAQAELI